MTTQDIEEIVCNDSKNASLHPKLVKSQVISASRRTDIPAFYMDTVVKSMIEGMITVKGPYGRVSCISLSPNDVKCIVWWSKNYAIWLEMYNKNKQLFSQYKHMFNFTITGDDNLERGVKVSLDERLHQLSELVREFGPDTIKLRFDPIVIYTDKNNQLHDNLENYEKIASFAHSLGITSIIFAFCLPYQKVLNSFARRGLTLKTLSLNDEKQIIDRLININEKYSMSLETCCGSQLIGYKNIKQSHCVDGNIISKYCHLNTKRKDPGQRKDCGCMISRDIGSYGWKCPHSCTYCYANPAPI